MAVLSFLSSFPALLISFTASSYIEAFVELLPLSPPAAKVILFIKINAESKINIFFIN